jgi:hypothetical protein
VSEARYAVDPAQLRAVADQVARGAAAVRALREHPGQLAGRAADAGDAGLQEALVTLGTRWDWGWGVVGDEAERWAVLLAAVADVYAAADAWLPGLPPVPGSSR